MKIEVGKYYRTRDGRWVGIDKCTDPVSLYMYIGDNGYGYEEDGRRSQGVDTLDDLIAEWQGDYTPTEEELHDAALAKGEVYHGSANPVSAPHHYRAHPSGIECIQITEHMGFNLGNAIKYIWRCDLKADAIEDLRKAVWYIQREISKREGKTK